MTDPLALGMLLYDSENYTAASLTEEAIWLFGDWAIQKLGKPTLQREAPSKAFPSGGIYLINDCEPCVQQLMIDAGPQGTRNSGHGHADALSIRFSIGARRFLVDPGTCCYISGTEDRDSFRDTAAHNTLRVDNLDQAVPEAPFAWSSIPNVTAETWLNGQTFDYFVGSHDGYRRLPDPVLHRRSVFHVKGGLWLVRDVAEGRGSHLLETFWHFAPELKVKEQDGIVLAESPITGSYAKSARLALLLDPNSAWRTEITAGFISPAYGSKQSAPVMRVSAEVELPEDCGVLLLPATLASEPVLSPQSARALPAKFEATVIRRSTPRNFCSSGKEAARGLATPGPATPACSIASWDAAGSLTLLWFLAASLNGAANDSFRTHHSLKVLSG